ncbi:MAG: response regulator [Pseudomonadota bacterium]
MSIQVSNTDPSALCVSAEGTAPLRILVVEDNLDLCQLVCELLGSFGHVAIPVGSGEDALVALDSATDFDVLLSDVSLPGMSGVDLARRVIALAPEMHVIFASGYGVSLTANLDFPAHSLTKPYDIDHLHQLLLSLGSANRDSRRTK